MDLKALFTPFPILSTPSLILRALQPSDLDDLYEYASDPQIDRYVPWEHYKNIEEARENLNEFLEEYEKDGLGAWGIEHRADRKLIGIINTSIPHRINRRVEMGYTISRAYWGQGYATEAVKTLIEFGFEKMDLLRIEAVVLPEHLASARVLEKSGMQYEGVLHSYQVWKNKPCDLCMYAIVNPKRK
ncbi:MAG: GNAT family N-acetyltransferase [Chloroflexi bacterium]|nr:GNAT family N-acetyltransferase [Chloroflexota bacterium]